MISSLTMFLPLHEALLCFIYIKIAEKYLVGAQNFTLYNKIAMSQKY